MTTTKEKNEIMYKNIIEHEVKLCKALFKIENLAHRLATDFCNGSLLSEEEETKVIDEILNKVDKLLNFKSQNIPVFFNGDCRGFTLKIDDDYMRKNKIYPFYSDWGGFGIIAPSFREV
jgi:hypothetical protein